MEPHLVLWGAFLLFAPCYGHISILSPSPGSRALLKLGSPALLSCQTNATWFFCLWHSPEGNKQCAIQENQVNKVCSGDARLQLLGSSTKCGVKIERVSQEDHGTWMCLVNDAENFEADKVKMEVEVAVPAVVEMNGAGEGGEVVVGDGEEVEVECVARRGYPPPIFTWTVPGVRNNGSRHQVSSLPSSSNHLVTSSSRLTYRGDLRFTGANLSCTVTQTDLDNITVIYMESVSVPIRVIPFITPTLSPLTQKIGIISGVLVSILFIFLLSIIIIIFTLKKKKRSSSPSKDNSHSDTSCETKSSVIKPIWTTGQHNQIPQPPQPPSPQMYSKAPDSNLYSKSSTSNLGVCLHSHYKPSNTEHLVQFDQVDLSTSASTGTVSSNISFEADRSVGGDLEEASISLSPNRENFPDYENHFSPNGIQNMFSPRNQPGAARKYNPRGLGQFDPSIDVHEISRPSSQTILNGGGGNSHFPCVKEPGIVLAVAPYNYSYSVSGHPIPCRPESSLSRSFSPRGAESRNSLRNDDGRDTWRPPASEDGKSIASSVFECQHGCFSQQMEQNSPDSQTPREEDEDSHTPRKEEEVCQTHRQEEEITNTISSGIHV